jgi:hypothetical protein
MNPSSDPSTQPNPGCVEPLPIAGRQAVVKKGGQPDLDRRGMSQPRGAESERVPGGYPWRPVNA